MKAHKFDRLNFVATLNASVLGNLIDFGSSIIRIINIVPGYVANMGNIYSVVAHGWKTEVSKKSFIDTET